MLARESSEGRVIYSKTNNTTHWNNTQHRHYTSLDLKSWQEKLELTCLTEQEKQGWDIGGIERKRKAA